MMSSARPRLAVFDCDGTLIDSQHAIAACMARAFGGEGLSPPAPAEVRRVIGLPLAQCVIRLAPHASGAQQGRLVEAYKAAFFALRQQADHHEPLFDGALAALDALERDGWLLGIATGKARRGLVAVLERHRLVDRFATIQTSDVAPGKPNPDMLLRAMAETGAVPANTVMIGDTTFDVQMALGARVVAIGVAWGYHAGEELSAAGATALADSFDALPDLVSRLTARGISCA
jgi:phosphoglycolate phosphatase